MDVCCHRILQDKKAKQKAVSWIVGLRVSFFKFNFFFSSDRICGHIHIILLSRNGVMKTCDVMDTGSRNFIFIYYSEGKRI